MEKITIAKALKTIVLPDGKTVHEGDEFVYNFDFENTGLFEIVGEQNGEKAPDPEDPKDKDAALTVEEMKAIRLKAKDLKIANWHTKGVERLIKEIAEAENKDGEIDPKDKDAAEIVTDPEGSEQEVQPNSGNQNNA